MPYLLYLLVCAIWGSSFILMKKAAAIFSPVSVGAWRVAGGAAVLGLMWWLGNFRTAAQTDAARGAVRWPFHSRHAWSLAFVVIVGYAWPYALQPRLVALHGSAFIAMTVSFVPLLTILVSPPLLGVYPNRRQLLGVVGGLACMAILMADGLSRRVPLADLCLAGTVPLSYALANTLIRRNLSGVPPLALSFVSLALASGLLLPLSWVLPGPPPQTAVSPAWAVVSLALLGVVGTGIAVLIYNRLVQEHGPLFAGMVTYLIPIGAILWGWVDHEPITPLQLAALVGILLMVAVVQYGAAGKQSGP